MTHSRYVALCRRATARWKAGRLSRDAAYQIIRRLPLPQYPRREHYPVISARHFVEVMPNGN